MKKINTLDVEFAYEVSGQGSLKVVLLHGWGTSHAMMAPVAEHLSQYFTVYNLDWPGFGESPAPSRVYTTQDYCDALRSFCEQLGIENPILIGHSFGCRIALRYAYAFPVHKLILTGAAGLRPKRGLDYYVKVYSYKLMKQVRKIPGLSQLGMQRKVGSSDYQALSGLMRATFVKVVNEDVAPLLNRITSEVLLVYGDQDQDTPLWMGQYLEKHLPNAGLAVFVGDDHYAYYHQMPRFLKVIDIFLMQEEQHA
jgi:pimeloyl-ACP methyl ester carboxylesterase